MTAILPFFFTIFVVSVSVSLGVAQLAWRRRRIPGAAALAVLMLAVAWWSFAGAIEWMVSDLSAKIFWAQLEYAGIAVVPVLWFTFALEYSGQGQWLTRRKRILLWIIPILTIGLAVTNPLHHWLWAQITLDVNHFAHYDHGGWFWIHTAYSYLLIFGGAFIILRDALRRPRIPWRQMSILFAGVAAPIIANVLYIFGLSPIATLDITVLGFALGGLLIAWSIQGFHLLDLGPLARGLLFENLSDGVLVLDLEDKIADMNPAALQLLGLSQPPIGLPLTTVLSAWQDQIGPYRNVSEAEFDLALPLPDRRTCHLNIRVSRLHDRHGRLNGHIVIARDVTERYEAEQRMRQLQHAVEQSPASVVITDAAGCIEYVNSKFTRLTGYSVEEALGKRPSILKSGRTPPETYSQLWQAISTGQEWRGEFINRKKNGETYWEEAHIAPVTNANGRITHYVAVKEDITERKQIEEDLRANRARLKAIFDNASVGITLLDRTGHYVQANQHWLDLIGYSPEELYGLSPSDLTFPDDSEAEERLRQTLLAGQLESFEREKRYVRKDGSLFWAALSATPIRAVTGDVEAVLDIVSDITPRKIAEEALRRHADRLLLLMQISMNINRSSDLEQVLHSAMEGLVRVLNYEQVSIGLLDESRQNLRLWAYHAAPGNLPGVGLVIPAVENSALLELVRTKAPVVMEDAVHDPRLDHIRSVVVQQHVRSLLLIPLLMQEEVVGSIGCEAISAPRAFTPEEIKLAQTVANLLALRIEQTRLLEDERHARQQVQHQAAELRGIIDSSRDGIFMTSTQMRLSVINAPALRMLNLSGRPVDWYDKPIKDVISALHKSAPQAVHAAVAELRRVANGGGLAAEGDLEIASHTIHWHNQPVRVGDNLRGWQFVLHDLTEERALEQLREDTMRTMVHDLRNPLASILGALEILRDGTLGHLEAEQILTINIAWRSAERMLQLVNTILEVSRLESGHMPVSPTPLRVPDLVHDVLQSQAAQARSNQIQLLEELPADLPLIKADLHLIQRVLQNLVGNAIKFTPAGGQVTVSALVTPGQEVQISVHDTGPGIPPEIHDRLFQKFVTGPQREHGTGLGLAFCKLALDAHGCSIEAASVPGHGARFVFALPSAAG